MSYAEYQARRKATADRRKAEEANRLRMQQRTAEVVRPMEDAQMFTTMVDPFRDLGAMPIMPTRRPTPIMRKPPYRWEVGDEAFFTMDEHPRDGQIAIIRRENGVSSSVRVTFPQGVERLVQARHLRPVNPRPEVNPETYRVSGKTGRHERFFATREEADDWVETLGNAQVESRMYKLVE